MSASLGDEYFKLTLVFRADIRDNPAVQSLLPSVRRSLAKPRKLGFTRAFFRGVLQLDVETPAGTYLGQEPFYEVDLTRLERIAVRTAKALFYHERGARLQPGYDMIAYSESGTAYASQEAAANIRKRLLQPLWSAPEKVIARDVFSYRFQFAKDDPNVSAWLLLFFKRVRFLCVSVRQKVSAAAPNPAMETEAKRGGAHRDAVRHLDGGR